MGLGSRGKSHVGSNNLRYRRTPFSSGLKPVPNSGPEMIEAMLVSLVGLNPRTQFLNLSFKESSESKLSKDPSLEISNQDNQLGAELRDLSGIEEYIIKFRQYLEISFKGLDNRDNTLYPAPENLSISLADHSVPLILSNKDMVASRDFDATSISLKDRAEKFFSLDTNRLANSK